MTADITKAPEAAMIEEIGVVHMTESEVEHEHHAVAVIKPSQPIGRTISGVIAAMKARGSNAMMDNDFANDIEERIKAQQRPWNPPS